MLTEKDYCDYDTCIALKELGYSESFPLSKDYEVLGKDYDILLYEAQKWMREVRGLHVEVRWYSNMWYEYEVKKAEGKVIAMGSAFPTYEEALRAAVYMATEYLKEK